MAIVAPQVSRSGRFGRASGCPPPLSRNLRDSPASGRARSLTFPVGETRSLRREPALQRCLTPAVRVPESFGGGWLLRRSGYTRACVPRALPLVIDGLSGATIAVACASAH